MDGNFSLAPKVFQQLYIIRAKLGNSAVTCAYALLIGRSQGQYEYLCTSLQNGEKTVEDFLKGVGHPIRLC